MPTTTKQNQQFDIGQFIQSIAQSIGRAGGMTMPQAEGQGVGANPSMALNQAIAQPLTFQSLTDQFMSKSAEKALTKYFDQHAQDALQHPDGVQALAKVVAQGQQQPEGQTTPQTDNQPTQQSLTVNQGKGMGLGGANVDQQGNITINQASPIMKGLLNWIGMGQNSFVNQDLSTIQGGRQLVGQTPEMQASINTATLQSMNDANQRLQSYRDQLTKEFAAEGATIPGWQKGTVRKLTPRMKEIQDELQKVNESQTELLNSFMGWKPANMMKRIEDINKRTPQYQVGQTVNVGGKNYQITGFKNGKHTIQEVKQ